VQANARLDLALLAKYDELLVELELQLVRQAKREAPTGFHLLRSIPGIGKVLAMTIVYELHDVARFERVQQFASYARLVKCAKESAGKRKGTSGAKMGNVHLKWAFSEAAVLFVRHSVEAMLGSLGVVKPKGTLTARCTLMTLATAWSKQHDFVASTIVGVTSEAQLEPILAASELVLSDDVMKACHAVTKEYLYPMG